MATTTAILGAILGGADTSAEIAARLGTSRNAISVALCLLAQRGLVESRGAVARGCPGRPYLRWRLRKRLSDS